MTDPLIKLYAGLTDQERGKMAFTYLAQGNHLELERIASTMSMEHFVGLPDGYRRMHLNLNNLTMMYAIAYWGQVAQCLVMAAGTMAHLSDPDPEAYKPIKQHFQAAEAALLAIEQSFDDVCLENCLDSAAMRFMAGGQYYEVATPDLKPDDVCLAGYREVFTSTMAF
jgi:hypothetical protein